MVTPADLASSDPCGLIDTDAMLWEVRRIARYRAAVQKTEHDGGGIRTCAVNVAHRHMDFPDEWGDTEMAGLTVSSHSHDGDLCVLAVELAGVAVAALPAV